MVISMLTSMITMTRRCLAVALTNRTSSKTKSSPQKLPKNNQEGVAETHQKVAVTKILLQKTRMAETPTRAVPKDSRNQRNHQLIQDIYANRSSTNSHA